MRSDYGFLDGFYCLLTLRNINETMLTFSKEVEHFMIEKEMMKLKKLAYTLLDIAFKELTYCRKVCCENKLVHEHTRTNTRTHMQTHTKQAHYSKKKQRLRH